MTGKKPCDCNPEDILNKIPDHQVYWSGMDIPDLGIKCGMPYDEVMEKFFTSYIEARNKKYDMGRLSDKPLTGDQINEVLISKLNNLTTKDIGHSGIPLNGNYISKNAAKYVGQRLSYKLSPNGCGSVLSINMADGFNKSEVYSTRLRVNGKSATGNNMIADSTNSITNTEINNESYPIQIEATVRLQTASGMVDAVKRITLNNPTETGDFSVPYEIVDRNNSSHYYENLADWLGTYEGTQANLVQYNDQLRNMEGGDIINLTGSHSKQISGLNDFRETATNELSNHQTNIENLNGQVSNIDSDVNSIHNDIQGLSQQVSQNPAGGGYEGTQTAHNQSLSTGVHVP